MDKFITDNLFDGEDGEDQSEGLLPSSFQLVGKTAAEIWRSEGDKLFAYALEQAINNPNGKLGAKILEKIVDRKLKEIGDMDKGGGREIFTQLNAFDETTMEKLNRGEISHTDLMYDEDSGMYVVNKDGSDADGNPKEIDMDDVNGNLYDPDAWEGMDPELDDLGDIEEK